MSRTLEDKLSLVLAPVLMTMDTNQNLEVLKEDTQSWKKRIWLENALHAEDIGIRVQNILTETAEGIRELTSFETQHTNAMHQTMFPFSWTYSDHIQSHLESSYNGNFGMKKCSCRHLPLI